MASNQSWWLASLLDWNQLPQLSLAPFSPVVTLALIAVGLALIYCYISSRYHYWNRLGIRCPPPLFPFGNLHQRMTAPMHNLEIDWARRFGPTLYGSYMWMTPVINILDPDLVRQVLIKDFSVFVNRLTVSAHHELFNSNIFMQTDDDWKRQVRALSVLSVLDN